MFLWDGYELVIPQGTSGDWDSQPTPKVIPQISATKLRVQQANLPMHVPWSFLLHRILGLVAIFASFLLLKLHIVGK